MATVPDSKQSYKSFLEILHYAGVGVFCGSYYSSLDKKTHSSLFFYLKRKKRTFLDTIPQLRQMCGHVEEYQECQNLQLGGQVWNLPPARQIVAYKPDWLVWFKTIDIRQLILDHLKIRIHRISHTLGKKPLIICSSSVKSIRHWSSR